jgi:hypothetical protein
MAANYTLTVRNVQLIKESDPSRYALGERYIYRLRVLAEVPGERRAYTFTAGSVTESVACAPGVAVVCFLDRDDPWIEAPADYTATREGNDAAGKVTARIQKGDTITIRATEQRGKLSRVKLLSN